MVRPTLSALALAAAVAGCAKQDPVDAKAEAVGAALPDINATAPTSTGEPHVATTPARSLPAPTATIPAALRGSWGLAPVDCMPGRRDAKGLLVIGPQELRFFRSRAVPSTDVDSDSQSIIGNFAFNGEGRSWTKYEALKIDKQTLVRTEMNPTASFTYAKCS
jgi:hypothetical protein